MYDLIHYTDKLNQKGIAIFLDFKKAFDSIEWNYLLETFQLRNFGHEIQNWIKIFYNNVTSCVLNNGHASTFFCLQRGVRQGCPLSGVLSVLGIELLSRAIKNDPTIKGIQVNKHELTISQYTDDTTVFVCDLGLAFLTNCNFAISIFDLDDALSTFYKKVLEYWCKFKILTGIDSKTNPKTEILWNNRKILVGKKPVFNQNWYDTGITKISDILNQNQDFLKWHELAIKFNLKVPFTVYYGLINAIPRNWKGCLKNPILNITHDTTVNTLKTSSIYSSLLNIIFVPPTAETKILSQGFTENTIQKVYLMPFAVTNEEKMIMLQYKVI